MTSDIQTILQLLQRQSTLGPPAYSTVTASPDYQRPAVMVQPIAALTSSHCFSHSSSQVRTELLISTEQTDNGNQGLRLFKHGMDIIFEK